MYQVMVYRLNRLLVTPAFFGAGMLSGLNASWSFCKDSLIDQCEASDIVRTVAGSILAWGISEFFWHVTPLYDTYFRPQLHRRSSRMDWP